jgi:hypothetical protein
MNNKKILIYLDENDFEQLKQIAKENDMSINRQIRCLVKELLKNNNKEVKK